MHIDDTYPKNELHGLQSVLNKACHKQYILFNFEGLEDEYVVFYVRVSTTTTLNKYSIVMFDNAVINEGNHFNTENGIFVAPFAGLFQFTWTTLTYNANKVET